MDVNTDTLSVPMQCVYCAEMIDVGSPVLLAADGDGYCHPGCEPLIDLDDVFLDPADT